MEWKKFNMGRMYSIIQGTTQKVEWRGLMFGNNARPRAVFILWLVCHERLSTKDRFFRFGMIDNKKCCLCSGEESIKHLFFDCSITKKI